MILIVDDNNDNIFSLRRTLETNGFKIDSATSGEEALKKVLKVNYSLIILDVQMPVMDGFEVAELLSSSNRTKDTPIIFLSAVNTDKRFITKGFDVGAVDYLTKPVDADVLLLKVKAFYKLSEKTRALKKAEDELTQRNNQLNTVLESLPQIAFMATAYGTVEYVNQLWYNYSTDRLAFPQTKSGTLDIESFWINRIQQQVPFECEVEIKALNSSQYKFYLLKVTPIKNEGIVTKWVGTFTDINEQKNISELLEKRVQQRTEELQDKNTMLEHSNYELQQFAAVASHDLKEPLRKIQIFSNIISEKNLSTDEQLNGYLKKIVVACDRMAGLINDLLQYSRLSKDDPFTKVDLKEVLSEVMNDLELTIQERKAQITVGEMPVIKGVSGQMRQVFQNMITNSLKFSKTGVAPVIDITSQIIDTYDTGTQILNKGPYCKITVTDNGIGFDETYLDKIFVIFQRLASSAQYEGTGIGLAIAKKIIDKHKGYITASSKPGQGATFVIVLPVK